MPTYGTIQRVNPSKPRLEVLRGFNPNEPFQQSATHPVQDDVNIASGQLIVLVGEELSPTGYEWIVCPTDYSGGAVYVAQKDSEDEDILSAGNMSGLSCAGQYELEMAFFDGAATDYTESVYLTPSDTVAGNVMPIAAAATTNFPAAAETVIGQITRKAGSTDGINSNVAPTDVITWRTVFIPRTA